MKKEWVSVMAQGLDVWPFLFSFGVYYTGSSITEEAAAGNKICPVNSKASRMLLMVQLISRVEKLPAGIDVTLPLLQAKIIETDPTVEAAVKSIFLASALQR